jgi:hypothetical protein
MVQDGRRATKPEDGGERQRIKDHVRLMLQKLAMKTQQPSDQKSPE